VRCRHHLAHLRTNLCEFDKEQAGPTFKRGFGFHPLCAFVDHGADGTGEPLAVLLRAGNAGSNTASDHIAVIRDALAQLPGHRPGTRAGRKVLIRADAAGCTHDVLAWMAGQRLSYSVGFTLPHNTAQLLELIPKGVWTAAYDAHDEIRDGAWVAELTGLLDLTRWPAGMRVIVRKERPHPGAQLRITDVDGMRITAFATNTKTGGPGTQLSDLELRQRRRARCEDRIRVSKDTGLMNLPLFGFDQNRIYCAIVALAVEVTAWMQMLALNDHDARRWEPKRLRLRLFMIPATIARTGRRVLPAPRGQGPMGRPARHGSPTTTSPHRSTRVRLTPTVPTTTGTTPGQLEPAPTRDDTRATVTPPCQNQHRRRRRSRTNTQRPCDERSGLTSDFRDPLPNIVGS